METAGAITELLDTTVGTGVLSRDAVEQYVRSNAATVLALEVTESGGTAITEVQPGADPAGTVVGVSIARQFTSVKTLTEHPYVHSEPVELVNTIGLTADEFPLGSVLVSCIAGEYQGQGLGRKITHEALGSLRAQDIRPILQFEWDRPDSPGVEKLTEAGYTPLVRLEDHFPPGWNCGACSASTNGGDCRCDVVVFRL